MRSFVLWVITLTLASIPLSLAISMSSSPAMNKRHGLIIKDENYKFWEQHHSGLYPGFTDFFLVCARPVPSLPIQSILCL